MRRSTGCSPATDWKGDVTIGNALFRTMAGGDIEVLTPGGGLQVAALGTAVGDGYGLVTLGYGDIDIFARSNVVVNRSRILTFGGGDEIIWSTLGDIDAGRGAKTTRVPSAPEIVTDADGVHESAGKPDISGSGIGTIVGFPAAEEGDVNLIAPQGTVNAGDAGIRVSGNLNIAALFVVNAANIEVQGKSKGVPVVEGPNIGGLTEASNTAGCRCPAGSRAAAGQRQCRQPSAIIVEVLGYGGGDGTTQDGLLEDRREKRSGLGQLTICRAPSIHARQWQAERGPEAEIDRGRAETAECIGRSVGLVLAPAFLDSGQDHLFKLLKPSNRTRLSRN